LGDGPPRFPQGFSCPVVLGYQMGESSLFVYRTFTFFGLPSQAIRLNGSFVTPQYLAPQPRLAEAIRFGLFRVRSPLLTESLLFSLPPGTEMVHFPGFALPALCIQTGVVRHDSYGVAPFGNHRINACLRLPDAYRSLLRPSSPLSAKASTVNP
jgi:hypothetical protein